MTRTVDVIIVNWNAGELLQEAVEALARSDATEFQFSRIVVVDNASSDGSADFLDEYGAGASPPTTDRRPPTVDSADSPLRTLPLRLVQNDTNRGFAAACNQGAAGSGADYILFLNPDTKVEPDTLDVSVRVMDQSPGTGILGVQLVDAAGRPQLSCARFPTPIRFIWKALGVDRLMPSVFKPHYLSDFDHRRSREVDQVMGAYFFVRRTLFEGLQGFDERFFVYFEEVDFAFRARKKGWSTYFSAEARVFHAGGGTTDRVRARRLFYSLRSRLLFARKHFDAMGAATVLFSSVFIELPARLVYGGLRGERQDLVDSLLGYKLFLQELPAVLRMDAPPLTDDIGM